ncbi:MAG: hypothetical protein JSS86_00300 [Cyanobacteria bacterium SZAS LIN-2]|nr:hypothetical protein [Cyanobacteria bacterium SZAS LIN-3]MBS1994708.1 hypothetical protein [Cyanobacteria bacterium SZAS LIN-2]
MALDNFSSAALSMIGMTFDSIGGLYLAYDLLGGERGPLSKLTRVATYSLMAFSFYAFTFNFRFALICGIGMGSIFGVQLDAVGAGKEPDKKFLVSIALGRMIVMGLGSSTVLSPTAAVILGVGAFCGSLASSKLKVSPEYWYEASNKPTFRVKRVAIGLLLGTFITLITWLGESISGTRDALALALRFGFVIGIGTGLIATFSPFVEWYADNLPPKRMGYIGAVMFLIGFFIQSLPSLIVLLGF